jgi:hypothetical protein
VKPVAVVAGYLARYPLGGHVLSILHYLVGLQRLGYEVVFVEDHGWPYSCFDPTKNTMTDDPSYGLARMQEWFERCGLRRWCYVDGDRRSRGLSRDELRGVCRDAEHPDRPAGLPDSHARLDVAPAPAACRNAARAVQVHGGRHDVYDRDGLEHAGADRVSRRRVRTEGHRVPKDPGLAHAERTPI